MLRAPNSAPGESTIVKNAGRYKTRFAYRIDSIKIHGQMYQFSLWLDGKVLRIECVVSRCKMPSIVYKDRRIRHKEFDRA